MMDTANSKVFCLLSLIIICTTIATREFIVTSIIDDVRKLYVSPSFFIVYDRRQYGFDRENFLVEAIKLESRKYTMSHAIDYESLARTTIQRENVLHALVINDRQNLQSAVNATRLINMNLHPWLLLFLKNSNFNCNQPDGNSDFFNLRMDTKMTAKCDGDILLKKYYSIFDNITEVTNVARWSRGKLIKFDGASLEVVTDMRGKILNLAKGSDANDDVNENISQFVWMIVKELAYMGRFYGNKTIQEERMGHYHRETNEWSGLMGIIKAGKADIGMVYFSLSNSRMNVVDFATPLVRARFYLYAKVPDNSKIRWDAYFQVFDKYTWTTIGVSSVVCPILLCAMNFDMLSISSFFQQFVNVWGMFGQQGLLENPTRTPARILSFSILYSSLIVYAIYSASITSYITQLTADLPFATYDEFLADDTYGITVLKESRDEDNFFQDDKQLSPLRHRLRKSTFRASDPYEGFVQACEAYTVFYTDEVSFNGVKSPPCKLGSVDMQRSEHMSFVLTKNSPYTRAISHFLFRLREHGNLNRLKNKYFYKFTEIVDTQPNVIEFEDVLPILSILIAGAIVAILVWFLEVMLHSLSTTTTIR